MLSQSLSDFYPWDSSSVLQNQNMLVLDVDSGSGEFAFNSLLLKLLRQQSAAPAADERIVLLSCNHSRLHYEYILRKFGYELDRLIDEDKMELKIVECDLLMSSASSAPNSIISSSSSSSSSCCAMELKMYPTGQTPYYGVKLPQSHENDSNNSNVRSSRGSSSSGSSGSNKLTLNWNELTEYLANLFPSEAGNASCEKGKKVFHLLIDDIDCLEYIAPNPSLARNLISLCCRNQRNSRNSDRMLSNIILFGRESMVQSTSELRNNLEVECDLSVILNRSQEEEQVPTLTEYCKYRMDVIVEVSGLSTGYSTEVHGILRIKGRHAQQFSSPVTSALSSNSNSNSSASSNIKSGGGELYSQGLLFKALDTGIRCAIINNTSK